MPPWIDPVPALKRQIAEQLITLTEDFSQTWAAAFLHMSQGRVSELRRGNLERMSLECLVRCLSRVGRDVQITTVRNGRAKDRPHWKIDGIRFTPRTRGTSPLRPPRTDL